MIEGDRRTVFAVELVQDPSTNVGTRALTGAWTDATGGASVGRVGATGRGEHRAGGPEDHDQDHTEEEFPRKLPCSAHRGIGHELEVGLQARSLGERYCA